MDSSLSINFTKAANEIIFAVGDGRISGDSNIVKAAAIALKIINEYPAQKSDFNLKHRGKRINMLKHALEVIKNINDGLSYSDSCKKVAQKENITLGSVQQACCRGLDLNAKIWNKMVSKDKDSSEKIKETLIFKYKEEKDNILKYF